MFNELTTKRKGLWDRRLRDISMLEDNWADGAKEIPDSVIDTTRILLESTDASEKPLPRISPTIEGGVRLAWENGGNRLLINVRDGSIIEIQNREAQVAAPEVYGVDNPDTAIGIINGWDFGAKG